MHNNRSPLSFITNFSLTRLHFSPLIISRTHHSIVVVVDRNYLRFCLRPCRCRCLDRLGAIYRLYRRRRRQPLAGRIEILDVYFERNPVRSHLHSKNSSPGRSSKTSQRSSVAMSRCTYIARFSCCPSSAVPRKVSSRALLDTLRASSAAPR